MDQSDSRWRKDRQENMLKTKHVTRKQHNQNCNSQFRYVSLVFQTHNFKQQHSITTFKGFDITLAKMPPKLPA